MCNQTHPTKKRKKQPGHVTSNQDRYGDASHQSKASKEMDSLGTHIHADKYTYVPLNSLLK